MLDIKRVSLDDFRKYVLISEIMNKRYDLCQFMKCIDSDYGSTYGYYIMFEDGLAVLGAITIDNYPDIGTIYINEIQSFVSGHDYGKKFLRLMNVMNRGVWFVRNYMAEAKLSDYYRSIGIFNEFDYTFEIDRKKYDTQIFYIGCDEKKLKRIMR